MSYQLAIAPNGTITAIYDDCLNELLSEGEATVLRASHVNPRNHSGSTAWHADLTLSGGPVLGPYKLRSEALAAEVAWLSNKLFNA